MAWSSQEARRREIRLKGDSKVHSGSSRKRLKEAPMMMDSIRSLLTRLGELTATPAAFGVFIAFFCIWLIFDHASFDWHAVATCATLVMTLFIKRAETSGYS